MDTLSLLVDVIAHYVLVLLFFYFSYGIAVVLENALVLVTGYSYAGIISAVQTRFLWM